MAGMRLPDNGPNPTGDLNATIEQMVERAVRKAMMGVKPPSVQITPPHVHVAAPQVRVDAAKAPDVTVAAPEVEVTVDLGALAEQIKGLRADVTALAAVLTKSVTRTVQRGSDGLIDRVTEVRGG